jgi:hypothetical protein
MSVDILPADDGDTSTHYQGDVIEFLNRHADLFDLMIAHPPCTYLALSGLHWNYRKPGRMKQTQQALQFVRDLMNQPIPHIAIENPVGAISTNIRKPDQYIQPYEFGHPESKKTGLWLTNLPPLTPTNILTPTKYQQNGKSPQWENQTATGQNKYGPSPDRWKKRSKTYTGIAEAMAQQWGEHINKERQS